MTMWYRTAQDKKPQEKTNIDSLIRSKICFSVKKFSYFKILIPLIFLFLVYINFFSQKKKNIYIMKRKLAKVIRILGIGLNELVIDIETSVATFNSVEWSKSENKIWLHIFHDDEEIQLTFDFDDLDVLDQYIIFSLLSSIAYN